jgi:uncharacterized repeat protein (TIGR01451 family)
MSRPRRWALVLLVVIVAGAWLAGRAAAAVLNVPQGFATIQAAIDAAASGDVVLVAPGTYVENIRFNGKAITVTSAQGAAQTVIDGNQAGSVATFASSEGPASVLDGFTLRNGRGSQAFAGDGGGILVNSASPTITNNLVTGNRGCDGVGISVTLGSPLIQGNRIEGNVRQGCTGGLGGGGLAIQGASTARILDNVIAGNTITSGDGGGISLFAAATPLIRGNVITGNTASGLSPCSTGGGIVMFFRSDADIVGNVIAGNTAGCGGGVYWLTPSGDRGPLLASNTIADNNAAQGSGVYADGFDVQTVLVNNVIVAAPGQTAVFCGDFGDVTPPTFRFNDVFAPGGARYGGVCTDQTGSNGNISADPLFVNASGRDYHLRAGSPAIDTGTNAGPGLAATDVDRDLRILDGNGDGVAVVDMGADEVSRLALTATVNRSRIVAGQTLVLGATVSNPGLAGAADLYAGVLLPDGVTVVFSTGTGVAVGTLADLRTFRPYAAGVALAAPFVRDLSNLVSYPWTGAEPRGDYLFFNLVTTAGALADGAADAGDVLGLRTATLTF